MTYNTIPVPEFSFCDVPERDAEAIANVYFQSAYNISYYVDTAKNDIRSKIVMQDNQGDRIVMLSYLINKLTERLVTLPVPRNPMEISVREQDTIPTYKALLHFLYRLIEQEGIEIPTALFDTESYNSSQTLLLSINNTLGQFAIDNPDMAENVYRVQEEVKKSKKFLWLGKEDWAKIAIGQIVAACIKEGLTHLMPSIIKLFYTLYFKMLE